MWTEASFIWWPDGRPDCSRQPDWRPNFHILVAVGIWSSIWSPGVIWSPIWSPERLVVDLVVVECGHLKQNDPIATTWTYWKSSMHLGDSDTLLLLTKTILISKRKLFWNYCYPTMAFRGHHIKGQNSNARAPGMIPELLGPIEQKKLGKKSGLFSFPSYRHIP